MDREGRRAALQRGAEAEDAVASALEAEGWTVLDRNWHSRRGELDLVVRREGRVRFVEVKARSARDPGGLDAVGPAKRRRLVHAAESWLLAHGEPPVEACFAVVVATPGEDGWDLEWIDDAFDA